MQSRTTPAALSVLLDYADEPLAVALEGLAMGSEGATPETLAFLMRVASRRHAALRASGPKALKSEKAARAWVERQMAPYRAQVREIIEGKR